MIQSACKTLIDQLTTWIIQLKCWVFGGVHCTSICHFCIFLWDSHWSPNWPNQPEWTPVARYARMLDEPDERLFPGRFFFGDPWSDETWRMKRYSDTESTFVSFKVRNKNRFQPQHSAEAFGVSSPTDWGVASRQDCTPGLTCDLQWDMRCQWRLIVLGCR